MNTDTDEGSKELAAMFSAQNDGKKRRINQDNEI